MTRKKRNSTVNIKSDKIQDMTISELKLRLQDVVDRLSQLVDRVTEKTDLGLFLIEICRVGDFLSMGQYFHSVYHLKQLYCEKEMIELSHCLVSSL